MTIKVRYRWLLITLLVGVSVDRQPVSGQVLNPPYFNLAEGRNISATATCGENVPEPELYCKLVGSNWLDKPDNVHINLIQGQACDTCDPNDPIRSHPPQFAIDGTERWWQSPPLSRGSKYNEVNLTIDLGQEFNVAYVFIKMGNSPRPGVWALERSRDSGKTYTPWQFFADTPTDCVHFFGHSSLGPIIRDDSVICETRFSKVVPLEGGEIAVSLLNGRPSADNFSISANLQEWSTATNIRLRLLRPKTTLGHLLSLHRQDPTVTRRYFYSIKDINIGGRCVCHGHASQCDQTDPTDLSRVSCRCEHNTCGSQCEKCCSGYQQQEWARATVDNPYVCEKCNCHKHSEDCHYDKKVEEKGLSLDINGKYSGGGVCVNCQHNTEGINCHKCKPGFYRPRNKPIDAPDVCQQCRCDLNFSTGNCSEGTGQCECKINFLAPLCDQCSYGFFGYPKCEECHCFPNGTYGNVCELTTGSCPCSRGYTGRFCKQCAQGYYGFPKCEPCDCETSHSVTNICDIETGQCQCANSYGGRNCDQCDVGFYNYPSCQFCQCNPFGSNESVCDNQSGICFCKEGFAGEKCDKCAENYFNYPNCTKCMCDEIGSYGQLCDAYGKCVCRQNFGGLKCGDCSPGFYRYPDCLPCACDYRGSNGVSCDYAGRCICQDRFEGEKCDKCKEGFYNFPRCEECNCNPAGLVAQFGGCDKVQEGKLCECKERVKGRICNQCKDLYWNLQISNPYGCEDCLCDRNGTVSGIGICQSESGQCQCKEHVKGRICDSCRDGTYGMSSANIFGCSDCHCDIGGAIHSVCNKLNGNCFCKPRIKGQRCTEPIEVTYFPTFYQFQYEAEDWRNPTGSPARFAYDQSMFPEYSWRGYAVFNDLQKEIITNLTIQKPSIYRVIIRFVNLNPDPVTGVLTLTPSESFGETQQSSAIHFEPSKEPKRLYVVGKPGLIIAPLVLNPGQWEASLKVDKTDLLIDYLVLIPQAYFDQTILHERFHEACRLSQQHMCRHYAYPQLTEESSVVRGQSAFLSDGDARTNAKLYSDPEVLKKLDYEGSLAILDTEQNKITMDLSVNRADNYAIVLSYHNPNIDDIKNKQSVEVILETKGPTGVVRTESVRLADCPYTFICRQIVTDRSGEISYNEFDSGFIQISLRLPESTPESYLLALDSVAAVPYPNDWSMDTLIPRQVCIKKNGQCIESTFSIIPEANKIEFEKDQNKDRISSRMPFDTKEPQESALPQLIFLDEKEPTVDIRGTVPRRGLYTFVVHYYQPENSNFEMEALIQNGQFHNGIVAIDHCPSRTGCRSVIRQRDTNATFFQVDDSFMLTLKAPERKNIWVDYILAVPVDHYDPAILDIKAEDKTTNSLAQCVQNSYFIASEETNDFCRSAIFSITVDFNGGALPCQCNTDGSYDYKCKPFGGQCNCKPNVIGRTCSRCKTGFYGFPQCKACNCPSTAVCHQVTGECICPRGVTGDECNKCLPLTFGFDPIIGCVDCNCEPYGVQNRDLQCDVDTGQCTCKANIVGRNCNKCKSGFWSYPHCQLCRCDLRGATEDICDQSTSRCFCKENVDGDYCDQCKPDAYYLEEQNSLGCTKCFCFGTTDRCTSSSLHTVQILAITDGWAVVSLLFTEKYMEVHPISEEHAKVQYESAKVKARQPKKSSDSGSNLIMYYSLPKDYLGNRISSYGGFLKYKLHNTVEAQSQDTTGIVAADLVLSGNNITVIHEHIEQPTIEEPFEFTTKLTEREFRHLNGLEVSREQLMMVLVRVEAIYIRATYFEPIAEVSVDNVLLDKAIEGRRLGNAPRALAVEQCNCPPNYRGTSCEECAPGYYRAPTGPYLGFCLPCNCNGHSNDCDPVTGKCFNCQFNTEGEHCERCISGYHGDANRGTPYDCLICACPLPIASNNFATSCELSTSGNEISCQCKEGYTGTRCDVCDAGHFGRPEVMGSTCQLCNCSGNIDYTDPASCESTTGACLQCLQNTAGRNCEFCAPGYYGDAVQTKNCSKCSCDECGTEVCNHNSGECKCKPNAVGRDCNECAPDHWGFRSCAGCRHCNCRIGAVGTQCDDTTGQCKCRPGVTGQTCDRCEAGYWKYSQFGCTSCNCAEKYSYGAVCDQQTGQCHCLPGVVGEKCDSCPHRWVFINKTGCQECGPCVHELLNDTDQLKLMIDPLRDEMQDTSSSVFAYRRLSHVNKSMEQSELKVARLKENPKQIDLLPIFTKAQDLNQESESLLSKSESELKEVAKVLVETSSVRDDSSMVDKLIQSAIAKSGLIVENLKKLEEGFQSASILIGQNIERKTSEAEWMLSEVRNKTFETPHNNSKSELQETKVLAERVNQFKAPTSETKDKVNATAANVVNVIKLLSELMNKSHESLKTIVKAEELNTQTQNRQFDQDINNLKTGNEEVLERLNKSRQYIENTTQTLVSADNMMIDMKQLSNRFGGELTKFKEFIDNSKAEMSKIKPDLDKAKSHSIALNQQSEALDKMFAETRNKANEPMRAANAYNSMFEALDNATKSAENAVLSAQKASDVSTFDGLDEYKTKSSELGSDARQQNMKIEVELRSPLNGATNRVDGVEKKLTDSQTSERLIEDELKRISEIKNLQELGAKAASSADVADAAAKNSEQNIKVLAVRIEEMQKNFAKMPEDLDEVKTAIRQSDGYIKHIASTQPDVRKMENLKTKYNQLKGMREGYKDKISQLRHQIDSVRDAANRIKLAAQMELGSSLQLHSPDSIRESATYTKLSLFFRTLEANALLAYIGNPVRVQKNRVKRQDEEEEEQTSTDKKLVLQDFMSLELESGYVVLNWDLGSGVSTQVRSTRAVNDWKWRQVIVERIGKIATLTVKSPDEEDDTTTGTSQGPSSVFNLDPVNTRIFIGGIPDNIQVQPAVRNKRFRGIIEEVMLGDSPLGLWNFKNSKQVLPAKEREALVNLDNMGGLHFDGNGYAVLSTRGPRNDVRINLTNETYIRLKFKTFAREGLIFLVGHERDFLALEIRDGFVSFKYDLGSGPFVVTSNETYNDGKWHSISANRFEKEGAISIDGVLLSHGEAIGRSTELSTTDEIYIGGYPDYHPFYEVTNVDFEGCIKELQIGTEQQNLQNLKQVLRAVPGCPSNNGRTASFSNDSTGYIAIESRLNLDRMVQITLNFKTVSPRGLLFYVANTDHSSHLAIYLNNGVLSLRVQPGGLIQTEQRIYSDKQWHYITATFTPERLRLDVDDTNSFTIETTERNELTLGEIKTIYFGGVPKLISSHYNFPTNIPTTFVGCFGDATVNENFQNFADTFDRPNASLINCPLMDKSSDRSDDQIRPIVTTPSPDQTIDRTPRPTIVTRRPTRPPSHYCKLSPIPAKDVSLSTANTIRFGDTHSSRHEFAISTDVVNGLTEESGFQIEFKTTQEEGVIFYVTSDNNKDYVSLYLLEGKVHYAWDCGSGRALIISDQTYNDDKWHKVTFTRKGRNGNLSVDDGRESLNAVSSGTTNSLNVKSPIFIGGIPQDLIKIAKNNLRGVDRSGTLSAAVVTSFPGCLRELIIGSNRYEFGVRSIGYNASGCSANVESGSFFHSDGGHIVLYEEFRVGSDFSVNLEVKPRTTSGVLLAVFGETDYLILYLENGKLTFVVDNGAGPINVTFVPTSEHYFCDGQWHRVEANKINNVVALNIDDKSLDPGIGVGGVSSTDTKNPLYIGGISESVRQSKGMVDNFVGCLRVVNMNGRRHSLSLARVEGHVTLNTCSTL